ncbi:hypothetical protein, partial [Azospirillum largimobile]
RGQIDPHGAGQSLELRYECVMEKNRMHSAI